MKCPDCGGIAARWAGTPVLTTYRCLNCRRFFAERGGPFVACGAVCGRNHAEPSEHPTVVQCYCPRPAGYEPPHYWEQCLQDRAREVLPVTH